MGAKAGSQAGLQTYDMFASTCFANYDMFARIDKDCKACKTYDMLASTWLAKLVQSAATLLLKNKHYFT